ncbi:PREDICTED: uncharacterized protein LOC105558496 isoform X2 [Vollenhovia emeryi]|uniref:uncharacterized protein LOC105558496 isoform X2 n=1 Tax=Vollenhovia emeryi TaxID=411798 RepID=UPI0005F4ADC9|nr:PREDICTED: uncharacterized protein LOC105558496 isoform X2 [Vollenhovia emeryi]
MHSDSHDNSQFSHIRTEKWREKSQGLRSKIYSRLLIPPLITKTSCKDLADMSRIPLMAPESDLQVKADRQNNIVMLEVYAKNKYKLFINTELLK